MNFKTLISPVNTGDFFDKYYEKKHLLIQRNNPNFYNNLLTVKDLDKILFSVSNTFPDFRIANQNAEDDIKSKEYTLADSRVIDALKFVKAYKEGSTLVMSALHSKYHSLRNFTNELETFFKHKFQTNVYLTPQKSQGFATHFDTHDVFIMQISGSKHWRIYDQAVTLADDTYEYNKDTFVPGNVIDEFTLQQGDLLYIPRGVVHDAYCTDSNSVHITTGLMGKTWAIQLAELLAASTKKHEVLRKYPKTHEYDLQQKQQEVDDLKAALNSLVDDIYADTSLEDAFYAKQKSVALGHLERAVNGDDINSETKIRLRETNKIRLSVENDILLIKFYDLKLQMPSMCEEFVSLLIKQDKFVAIKDIDINFDTESKVLLIQQLDTIGIIEVQS